MEKAGTAGCIPRHLSSPPPIPPSGLSWTRTPCGLPPEPVPLNIPQVLRCGGDRPHRRKQRLDLPTARTNLQLAAWHHAPEVVPDW
ncbi:hypothetical protein SEA_BILLNYE_93 [Streptomyces phage BillNye]|uniref:Uncharacterized protein n=1 Tax=Streptomyces phage BillNye TaxID=2079426 RepID=A0A2L1IVU2_9CAUD|nr:hypothetical protein FDJ30_gp145 [Streptomyces phage BillNye]AVD99288.1 hypothetical protein SEA_BILLNYE_93 [Streptomyces phage BillNye]